MLPFRSRGTEAGLRELGVEPGEVFPAAPASPYFRRRFRAFQPRHIADSVYSRYTVGDGPVDGYRRLRQGMDAVVAAIAGASGPTYTYFYWPDIDVKEHEHGATSREAFKDVARLDAELARLKHALGPGGTVVVSADHGQVTVPDSLKYVLEDGDDLQGLLRVWPPAGEPRFVCFHVRAGYRDDFRRVFEARFGEAFILLSADEVDSLRLLGPGIMSPETRRRVGDFVAIPEGLEAMGYAGESAIVRMKGFHGGLSPAEMRVPLVVA
jgi:hypothetical protein